MEPSRHELRHFRLEALRAPEAGLELKRVDTVLFLLERGPLQRSLANIITCAAVHRAVTVERGAPPELKVLQENVFCNSFHGFGKNTFVENIARGSHALLLTGATLYNREMASLVGAYALKGATLEGFPSLVDDEVPIGLKEDPEIEILSYVQRALLVYDDKIVRSLVRKASLVATPGKHAELASILGALDTLQVLGIPRFRRTQEQAPPLDASVFTMIEEWSQGREVPSNIIPLIERHREAKEIAESIWQGSTLLADGVHELLGIPVAEMDEVVRRVLGTIFEADRSAKVVLEKNRDLPANKLRYDEAIAFERRLGAGESASVLLSEVEEILSRRNDSSALLTIGLDKDREREPEDTLEKILKPAQYIPDPSGYCYTMLKGPQEEAFFERLQRVGFPLITHNALWLCDVKKGSARPSPFSFQVKDLQMFLAIIDPL